MLTHHLRGFLCSRSVQKLISTILGCLSIVISKQSAEPFAAAKLTVLRKHRKHRVDNSVPQGLIAPFLDGLSLEAAPAVHDGTTEDRLKYDILQAIRPLTLLRQTHLEQRINGKLFLRTPKEMPPLAVNTRTGSPIHHNSRNIAISRSRSANFSFRLSSRRMAHPPMAFCANS